MTNSQNLAGHFDPIHAAHAIEQVVFSVKIDRTLSDEQFSLVRETVKQFKSDADMPGQSDIQSFGLAIGGSPGFLPPPPISGVVLFRTGTNGVTEKELRVERDSIIFRTVRYTRWDSIWEQAKGYFQALLPLYLKESNLIALGLNYVDKFVWVGDSSSCKVNLLLQPSSKYVSSHIFEAQDFWHSHTGAFIRADENTKRLLNVNVDFVDEVLPEGARRVVSIATVLTDLFNQPGYGALIIAKGDEVAVLESHMKELHVFGKAVIGNIINSEMSKRIALTT